MAKIVVVPDIHDCEYTLDLLERADLTPYDKVIFLGDYTDGYFEISSNPNTANLPCHRKDVAVLNDKKSESMKIFKLDANNVLRNAGTSILRKSTTSRLNFLNRLNNKTYEVVNAKKAAEGVINMLNRLKRLKDRYPNKVVLLLGNHDLAYMASVVYKGPAEYVEYTFNFSKSPQPALVSRQYLAEGLQSIVKRDGATMISNQRMNVNLPLLNEDIALWFINNAEIFDVFYKFPDANGRTDYNNPNGGLFFSHYIISPEDVQSIRKYSTFTDLNEFVKRKDVAIETFINMYPVLFEHETAKPSFYTKSVFGHCMVPNTIPEVYKNEHGIKLMCDVAYRSPKDDKIQANNNIIIMSSNTTFFPVNETYGYYKCNLFFYD